MTAVLKCKMCGGDLEERGSGVAICLYCGSTQIIPKLSDERKTNLYDRANHYRSINEFDKATAIYEQILAEDNTDSEVYWDMVLCRYGVEYVEDPHSHERIPTINRAQFRSVYDDNDYQQALKYATYEQKQVLQTEAKRIDLIQKGILEISSKEAPYDIFICYKETDDNGSRTIDSVLAQDIYNELIKEGYKVFFSRISLEDKIGTAFEPYIFAALHSAKVMIVVGTNLTNFNAVWVKNEWMRFLSLINAGEKKVLIPAYKDINPYDLPEEFAHLQAQDMGKIGFIQDLLHGINKIIIPQNTSLNFSKSNIDIDAYKKRVYVFLDNGEFDNAQNYCDKILDVIPDDAETYCMRLCAELHVKRFGDLSQQGKIFDTFSSYQNAMKFGTPEVREELERCLNEVKASAASKKKQQVKIGIISVTAIIGLILIIGLGMAVVSANKTKKAMTEAKLAYEKADELIRKGDIDGAVEALKGYEDRGIDSDMLIYLSAQKSFNNADYSTALEEFSKVLDKYDSNVMKAKCEYYLLEANLNTGNITETMNELVKLEKQGIEDVDNLDAQIMAENVRDAYEKEAYGIAKQRFDLLKEKNETMYNALREECQEEWYNKALSIEKEMISNPRNMTGYNLNQSYSNIHDLMSMCAESYKDVKDYLEIVQPAYRTFKGDSGLDYSSFISEFRHVQKYDLASYILWDNYSYWLPGTWKTSDGAKYFKLSQQNDGEYSFWADYNIPYFNSEGTFFEIDRAGVYYIFDKNDTTTPPKSAKDMFRFDLINESQMGVFCCKDSSTYMLYKQN